MTSKQKTILNMSLIPLVIIILLILGTGYFLLEGEIKLPKFKRGPQIRRLDPFPTVVYTEKPIEKQRRVIKSEKELNEFLNYIDETGLLTLKEKVNFEKEFVIGVSTDTNDQTDNSLRVKKVYEDQPKSQLIVSVKEEVPGENCEVTNDKNVAVDLVAISKTEYNITFDRVKSIKECKRSEK